MSRNDTDSQSPDEQEQLVNEYVRRKERFDRACKKIMSKCSELCQELALKNSWITGRTKDPDSLRQKLALKKYGNLSEVPDLVGVRVVLDDRPQVLRFTAAIQKAFTINWRHTTTHRLEIDQVGYASRHFVIEYSSDDDARSESLNCEIQLRTLLQHAWAQTQRNFEIYKQKRSPSPSNLIRRRLNIISGLLESADSEIENAWSEHRLLDIGQGAQIGVTADSLTDLLSRKIVRDIMRRHGFNEKHFDAFDFTREQLAQAAEDLRRNGVNTISQIVVDLFDYVEILAEAISWPAPIAIDIPLQVVMLTSSIADLENRTNMIDQIPALDPRVQHVLKMRLVAQNPGRF
jgi:ppGpp synthetase/RelA/SpoT-type nucleotidyltranferase